MEYISFVFVFYDHFSIQLLRKCIFFLLNFKTNDAKDLLLKLICPLRKVSKSIPFN